jgi:hypothetical protein
MKRDKRALGLVQHLPDVAETQILDFVGRGEWFFVGQVSKKWRYSYLKHLSRQNRQPGGVVRHSNFKAPSRRVTSYKSVLASVPRLKLAISNGFNVERQSRYLYHSWLVAFAAGKYADKEVLLWLKTYYRALWGESVCGGAIEGGRLEMLQWLHEKQQCAWNDVAGSTPAKQNSLPMLRYIYRQHAGGVPSKHDERVERSHFAICAVQSNNLTLLRWCAKRRLLVDGFVRGDPNMYLQSITSNCTVVQPWLFRHRYRLPVMHDEYAAMMARHQNDLDTDSNNSDNDSTSGSVSSSDGAYMGGSSGSNSSDSDGNAGHDSSVHDEDEETDDN